MAFLAQFQLPPVLAMRLRQVYGDAALEKVRENPYLLSSDDCGVEFSATDEISPDTCRLWDSKTHEKLDKDRFRRDMGGVEDAYAEIMKRLLDHDAE